MNRINKNKASKLFSLSNGGSLVGCIIILLLQLLENNNSRIKCKKTRYLFRNYVSRFFILLFFLELNIKFEDKQYHADQY